MSGATFETVQNNRRAAASLIAAYNSQVDAVRANRMLSPIGQAQEIAQLYNQTRPRVESLRDREPQLIADGIERLEQALFGNVAFTEQAILLRRDAEDRASRLEEPSEALDAYLRASRSNDPTLARAIFRRAYEAAWFAVEREHTGRFPRERPMLAELKALREYQADTGVLLTSAGHYFLSEPAELGLTA